jgi:hypothetical protein
MTSIDRDCALCSRCLACALCDSYLSLATVVCLHRVDGQYPRAVIIAGGALAHLCSDLCHREHTLRNMSQLRSTGTTVYKDIDYHCIVCGAANALRCGGCSLIHYCSTKCQRQDWSRHKSVTHAPKLRVRRNRSLLTRRAVAYDSSPKNTMCP